jgi:hypothetical protein
MIAGWHAGIFVPPARAWNVLQFLAETVRPQGVEPELYAPAELLSGRGAGLASSLGSDIGAAERDPTRPHTWFSNLFNGGAAGGSTDSLQRDSRAATASASALDHPPQVQLRPLADSLPHLDLKLDAIWQTSERVARS